MRFLREVWSLIRETVSDWIEDRASQYAAALAFFTIFSLAPLMVFAIAVAGAIFGEDAAEGHLVEQLRGLLGEAGASLVESAVQSAARPAEGLKATLLGLVFLLVGASGVFSQLQTALNVIWEVPPPRSGVVRLLRDRLAAFGTVLVVGFLLLASIVLSAALSAVGAFLEVDVRGMRILEFLLTLGLFTVLFAMLFKLLPDVRIAWKDTWVGAAVTAFLFNVGKTLIGLYLGRTTLASTYGAAGSLAILLAWVYYSAQIIFLGAEFTQVFASRYGSAFGGAPGRSTIPEPCPEPSLEELQPPAARPRKVSPATGRAPGRLLWLLIGFLLGRRLGGRA